MSDLTAVEIREIGIVAPRLHLRAAHVQVA
jgi:hypothetical protein